MKRTTEEFIEKAKQVHGDKYDYSQSNYIGCQKKIDIICKEHGLFSQQTASHMKGVGCPKCAIINKTSTKNIFIEKAKKVHGDKYDYTLVHYKNSQSKVKIICHEHGIFEQQPNMHVTGRGCLICGKLKDPKNIVVDKKSFIVESNKIHNNKYDYSLVDYKNSQSKVKIICHVHGVFEQKPSNHVFGKGKGCGRCGKTKKLNLDIFLSTSNKVHNFKYNYKLVKFINVKTKVKIKCPIHNIIFEQTPNHHMKGVGCPICNESQGEKEIRILFERNNIKFKRNKKFKDCKYKKLLSFDFYLVNYNICIEYNGKQHYHPIDFFGGELLFLEQQQRDQIKRVYCENNNIKLIIIRYDENILDKLSFLKYL